MAHRTTVATSYKWRLILIALVCLGYAGLCVKDGAFTYPAQIEKRAFYNQFVEDNGPDPALWAAKARELGWPIEEPDKKEEKDILTQWVQFAIVFPIGFFHLCLFVRWGRRFIEGDEAGVRTNGGKSFTWDQVTEVDATKWDRKGIARIAYDTGGGTGLLVLDDWKLERTPADAIFDLLRANVDADKIKGLTSNPGESDAEAEDGGVESREDVSEPVDSV